jgi:hypothetical protein
MRVACACSFATMGDEKPLAALIAEQADHLVLAQRSFGVLTWLTALAAPAVLVGSVVRGGALIGLSSLPLELAVVLAAVVAAVAAFLASLIWDAFGDPRAGRWKTGSFDCDLQRLFTEKQSAEEDATIGWLPVAHTAEEAGLLRYFELITVELEDDDIMNVWAMKGAKPKDPSKQQLSFTSIRYHVSFVAYA